MLIQVKEYTRPSFTWEHMRELDKIDFRVITLADVDINVWLSLVGVVRVQDYCFSSFPQTQSGHLATAVLHSIRPAVKPRKVDTPFHLSELSQSYVSCTPLKECNIINPWHACAVRVTVLSLSVCLLLHFLPLLNEGTK